MNTQSKIYIKDVLFLLIFNLLIYLFFIQANILGSEFKQLEIQGGLHFSQLFTLVLGIIISFSIFAYRRAKEVKYISLAYDNLTAQNPVSRILNRSAGKLMLHSWYEHAAFIENPFSIVKIEIAPLDQILNIYGEGLFEGIILSCEKKLMSELVTGSEVIRWSNGVLLILVPDSELVSLDFSNQLQITLAQHLFAVEQATVTVDHITFQQNVSLQEMLESFEK